MLQIVLDYMEPHNVSDPVCARPAKLPAEGALNSPVWYNKQYDISESLKQRLGKEMTEALVKRGRTPSMSLCDALAYMVEDLPTEIPIFWDPETAQSALSRAISEVCPNTKDGRSLSETLLKTVKEWPNWTTTSIQGKTKPRSWVETARAIRNQNSRFQEIINDRDPAYAFVTQMTGAEESEVRNTVKSRGRFEAPICAQPGKSILVTKGFINGREHSILWDTGASINVAGADFLLEHPNAVWTRRDVSIVGISKTPQIPLGAQQQTYSLRTD
jgi:hypothetical protein